MIDIKDHHITLSEVKQELKNRFKDHHITYREAYTVLGFINPDCPVFNPNLDEVLWYNPELDNGSYI